MEEAVSTNVEPASQPASLASQAKQKQSKGVGALEVWVGGRSRGLLGEDKGWRDAGPCRMASDLDGGVQSARPGARPGCY